MILDFSQQSDYLWALLPEIILSAWAMVVLLVGVWKRREDPDEGYAPSDLGWVALAGILVTAGANGWLYGLEEAGGTSMVTLDHFRLFANWIFLLAAAFATLISFTYVKRQGLQMGEFYALILLATVGMMLMAGTRDLIVIFLGLEVMSIAAYVLTAFNRRDRRSAEAGLKYFILGAFSSAFFLYGLALVYGATGSTNLSIIALSLGSDVVVGGLLVMGIGLLGIGFAFKISAVPFHMWTPDVYEGAPAPVTAFMSAGVKAAAFVTFARVFLVAFDGAYGLWYPILWWVAAITMVVANLVALVQANVKRMLAYSSVAHAGYLLVAVVAANQTATAGLLFYLLVYTLMNIGAFAVLITVAGHGEDRLQLEDYSGFGWRQPALGVFFTVFLLSLAGFPGTGGFMGKIFLLQGAAEANLWTLAVILVLTTLVSYWYYLRVAWYMWMREPGEDGGPIFAPLSMRAALLAGTVLILLLGVFPGQILEFARTSAESLISLGGVALGP